jgi:histidinol-phosphatase (PHP family)
MASASPPARTPELTTTSTRLYDGHMHTPLCKHADGEPEEYAQVGIQRGLAGVIFTCHNPLPDGLAPSVRMSMDQFDEYVGMVNRATIAMQGRTDVRLGLECDYWPGLEGFLEKQLASAEFHHVLGSVHPQMGDYQKRFWTDDPIANQRVYFQHLAMAAETGLFDTLSHPDLIKNCYSKSWQLEAVYDDILASLDRIAKTGVALELNTSGLFKSIREFNPGQVILQAARERNIPIVVGSDSHVPGRVADQFPLALNAMLAAGYTHTSYFLSRKRHDVLITDALGILV